MTGMRWWVQRAVLVAVDRSVPESADDFFVGDARGGLAVAVWLRLLAVEVRVFADGVRSRRESGHRKGLEEGRARLR